MYLSILHFSGAVSMLGYFKIQIHGQAQTMNSLIDDWNQALDSTVALVDEHNKNIAEAYRNDKLLPEAMLDAIVDKPQKISYPGHSWLRWWKSQWGWTLLSRAADSQSWLPYHHNDMQQARDTVADLMQSKGVHPNLILNYDQIWRNAFTADKAPLMHKERSGMGRKTAKKKIPAHGDKKIHSIRGARRSITVTCWG